MERILEQCNPLCLSCECGDSSISAQSQKERPGQGCPLPLTSAIGAVARPENRSQRNTARLRREATTPHLFYSFNFYLTPLAWLLAHLFPRRVSLDGEGVDLAFQLGRERVVDQPVAVDPRLAGELGRHHEYAEMALARAGRALVARMHMRLVDHVEPGRPERDHQFLSDCRRDRHSGSCPFRKAYPDILVIHGRAASTRGARGRRPTRHMPPRGGNHYHTGCNRKSPVRAKRLTKPGC